MAVLSLAIGSGRADAASAAPTAPSWEGFYLGGDIGYGSGVSATTQPQSTNFVGSQGFTGGLLGGYNHMLAARWLVGIEADASWSDVNHIDNLDDGFGDIAEAKFAQKQTYSVRARAGYLLTPGTLLYGTGGWAASLFTLSFNAPNAPFSESDTHWLGGAQIGAGIETMLTRNWTARLEYLQTFYANGTFNNSLLLGGPVDLRPSVGVGRLALIYRFGSGEAAPWDTQPAKPAWNGVYTGGVLGTGVGNAKVSFSQAPGTTVNGIGATGAAPGFLIGYNWRVAPRWVVSLEDDVAPGISTAEFQVDWTDAVRGRLGYLLTPATLLYGSAGWLTTGIRTTSLLMGTVTIPSQRVNAMGVGGGVETALTDHWAIRFEYNYLVSTAANNFVLDLGTITGPVSARATMQSGLLGVVYMFSGR